MKMKVEYKDFMETIKFLNKEKITWVYNWKDLFIKN